MTQQTPVIVGDRVVHEHYVADTSTSVALPWLATILIALAMVLFFSMANDGNQPEDAPDVTVTTLIR